MNKPLIAPEKAAAVEARVVASFRPLVEHLRTGVAPAVSAAGVKMGRSIRESFQRPA